MATGQTEDGNAQPHSTLDRRTYLRAVGAAVTLAGAGNVAAAEELLNYASAFIHDPWIEATLTIGVHDGEDMSSELEYIDNDGNRVSLSSAGGIVATREESDEPHNPVALRADKIAHAELTDWPRGETYDDGDDEDADVYALDATHWTVDESGTGGTLTVEDVDSPAGTTALHVAAADLAADDVATATFGEFESISSGIARKYLQLVVTVDELPSETAVYLRVKDDGGNAVETWIDADADSGADGTIATATGPGQVYQRELGELDGVDDLDEIAEVEIAVEDGDVDLTLTALNLERESRWSLGSREYEDDDDVSTETVYEPSDVYEVTGVDSLDDDFGSATIHDLEVDVEFVASELGDDGADDWAWYEDDLDYDYRLEHIVEWDLPTAYDLSYDDVSVRDEVRLRSGRYDSAGVLVGAPDETVEVDQLDDQDGWSDEVSTYSDAGRGDEITLTTSPDGGERIWWHVETLHHDDEHDDATSEAAVGAGPTRSGGFIDPVLGVILSAIAGVLGYAAWVRRRAGV